MTDQPTTWTPELEDALKRVIKSVDTIQLSYFTQQLREKVGAALESAAAEIERQKALTEKALSDGQEMTAGLHKLVASLRAELAAERDRAHRAEQAHAVAESKVDEMLHPAAQQGPSDEEIAYALANDIQGPVLRKVLRMLARRAGVKL